MPHESSLHYLARALICLLFYSLCFVYLFHKSHANPQGPFPPISLVLSSATYAYCYPGPRHTDSMLAALKDKLAGLQKEMLTQVWS